MQFRTVTARANLLGNNGNGGGGFVTTMIVVVADW
jgi:hypothetical protein